MPIGPGGTLPGNAVLDGPPPSPATDTGMSPGPSPERSASYGALVPGAPISSGQLPPEMLTGMMQAGQTISETIDSFAQAAPDLAPDFQLVKDALLRALAKLLTAGANPMSPTAPGPNFPGGGFEQGSSPLALGGPV